MTYNPLLEDRTLSEAPHLVFLVSERSAGRSKSSEIGLSYNRLLRSCP